MYTTYSWKVNTTFRLNVNLLVFIPNLFLRYVWLSKISKTHNKLETHLFLRSQTHFVLNSGSKNNTKS